MAKNRRETVATFKGKGKGELEWSGVEKIINYDMMLSTTAVPLASRILGVDKRTGVL